MSVEYPVTETQRRFSGWVGVRRWLFFFLILVLIAGVLTLGTVVYAVYAFNRSYGITHHDDETHFKYGSIGAELANGLPYRLLLALPEIFPEEFGEAGDYSHFGFIYEKGKNIPDPKLPIGFAKGVRNNIEVAWFNCAICHTGKVKLPGATKPTIISGMPANTVDLERFFLALFRMAEDKDFSWNRKKFKDAINRQGKPLSVIDEFLWGWLVVPNVRAVLLDRRNRLLPLLAPQIVKLRSPRAFNRYKLDRYRCEPPKLTEEEKRREPCRQYQNEIVLAQNRAKSYEPYMPDKATPWGPGRVDTFNPYKLIHFDIEAQCLTKEERIGISDFPSIYLQGPRGRQMMHLHWDGNNASLKERNLSAALGAGVTEDTVNHTSIGKIATWLQDLKPPKSPYKDRLNREQVERGKAIYSRYCAECHGFQNDNDYVFKGAKLGKIEPWEYIKTDPHRLRSYTFQMEEYQKERLFCRHKEHRFQYFKKTGGYANQPLDGLWLRAPYLHNGSVPTLADLLKKPEERPQTFIRGLLELDASNGGFKAPPCEPGQPLKAGICFDTKLEGNANGGHNYGTDLSDQEKQDLLAYLLSF